MRRCRDSVCRCGVCLRDGSLGFTKQPNLKVMAFWQMARYWGALTPVDNLRNSAPWKGNEWVCNCQYQRCNYRLPFFRRASMLVLAHVKT